MARKAAWYDYLTALFDDTVGIHDGDLVYTSPGISKSEALPLTNAQYDTYRNAISRYGLGEWAWGLEPGAYAEAMKRGADGISIPDIQKKLTNTPSNYYLGLSPEALDFWNSLTDVEKDAYLSEYGNSLSYSQVYKDLEELAALGKRPKVETFEMPLMSDYIQSDEDIYKEIDNTLSNWYNTAFGRLNDVYSDTWEHLRDSELRLLDDLSETKRMYNAQLQGLNDSFEQRASALSSQQYLANAQTYDALRSDLRRSRQNALEAGASAGVRIASNVNALLTAQNKQSAASMDTANALAEMLLQHRNAVSGMSRDFANYRSGINRSLSENDTAKARAYETLNSGLNDLETSRLNMRDTMYTNRHTAQTNNYNTAMADYNAKTYNAGIAASNWDKNVLAVADSGNPFAEKYKVNARQ